MTEKRIPARDRVRRLPIDELFIVPFNGMPLGIAHALALELEGRGIKTHVDEAVPLPSAAYAPARGQFRADSLLDLLSGYRRHVLGVTHRDLFAGDLNFVFGIAAPAGACLVSTARLLAGADDKLFLARLLKEAVHELGHTLGLPHCPDPDCVMRFSNSLADTDRKGDAYCSGCLGRLRARQRRR